MTAPRRPAFGRADGGRLLIVGGRARVLNLQLGSALLTESVYVTVYLPSDSQRLLLLLSFFHVTLSAVYNVHSVGFTLSVSLVFFSPRTRKRVGSVTTACTDGHRISSHERRRCGPVLGKLVSYCVVNRQSRLCDSSGSLY